MKRFPIRWEAAVAASLLLLLAGCATPFGADKGYGGYADSPIEGNLFRVAFTATPGLGPQAVHDLALLRAAEITQEHGKEWFSIVRENRGITTRLQLLPAQGFVTSYAQPTWVSTPNGPVMVMQSFPYWQSTSDPTNTVPVPYSELFFRTLAAQAAAGKEPVYQASVVIREMRAKYKIGH